MNFLLVTRTTISYSRTCLLRLRRHLLKEAEYVVRNKNVVRSEEDVKVLPPHFVNGCEGDDDSEK